MKKEQIKRLIEKYKYIFIGEIHGTKKIPNVVFDIVRQILKKNKIIFCLELPQQAEEVLYAYLRANINKKELLASKYLQDAIFDSRINDDILLLYEKLNMAGVELKCLENYEIENVNYRDQEMAKKFLNIVKKNKADKYFVYVGSMHTLDKSIQIKNFKINPITIYLHQGIKDNLLVIQFKRQEGRNKIL